MKFNCDLGEGLDELDAQLMPHLDQASIACGGHAGDTASMTRCVELALRYEVSIGAHPSYPDRDHFGRRSLHLPNVALAESLAAQTHALSEICLSFGTRLRYIKAHGALYNDMVQQADLFELCLALARRCDVPLMVQALPPESTPPHYQLASTKELILEAFADRAYEDDGRLAARTKNDAVLADTAKVLAQVDSLIHQRGVFSLGERWLNLNAQTICFHSDSPKALEALTALSRPEQN